MERCKIYISGRITGLPKAEYEALFNEAEANLKGKGYEVITPIRIKPAAEEIDPATKTEAEIWQAHIKADIRELMNCHAVYMLHNWELSEGATLEHSIAIGMKLPVIYEIEPRHRDIKDAIQAAMRVPFRLLATDSRSRWHVYARMIYAHHAKKDGSTTAQIATETNHDESTIGYYLRQYDGEYKFNREFRKAAEKIATILSKKLKVAECTDCINTRKIAIDVQSKPSTGI